MFATHPPLTARIRALEPGFDDSQYPEVYAEDPDRALIDESPAAGFAAPAKAAGIDPQTVIDAIGQPGPAQIAYASALHAAIPEELLAPARSPDQAYLMVIALLVSHHREAAERQFVLLAQKLGERRAAMLRRYYENARAVGPRFALPLMEIAFPAVRQSSDAQQSFLLDLASEVIELDGHLDLREFCLYRVLSRSLTNAATPNRAGRSRSPGKVALRRAAMTLIKLVAFAGHDEGSARQRAFDAGLSEFGSWTSPEPLPTEAPDIVGDFSRSLDVLQNLNGRAAETLVRAAAGAVLNDGQVTITEAEMLRTVCASLGCPVPPVVAGAGIASD